MCTLNKRQNQQQPQREQVREGAVFQSATKLITSEQPVTPTQTLVNPVVCSKCRTLHYSHSLSCKKCGDYFHTQLQVVGTPKFAPKLESPTKVITMAATLMGIVGVFMMVRF